MNSPANQIEDFRTFAKTALQHHMRELETRYQNREPASHELKQEAYWQHRQTFEKELTEKMEALLTADNGFLRPALTNIKEKYVGKLQPSIVG